MVPDYRSADLYEALLLAGVAYLRRLGAVWAELESWGDDPAVLARYQAQGFEVLRREVAYRRPAGRSPLNRLKIRKFGCYWTGGTATSGKRASVRPSNR